MTSMISMTVIERDGENEKTHTMTFHGSSKDEFLASLDRAVKELGRIHAGIAAEILTGEKRVPVEETPKTVLPRKILYRMHCGQCGSTFMKAAREDEEESECACGAAINLRDAGDFHFVCEACGETCDGRAITKEPDFAIVCKKCRNRATLRWNQKNRRYENA